MATITKRNNKYVVIYDYKDESGKRKQKWESFEKREDAVKYKNEVEANKSNKKFINPSDVTVAQFLEEWVEVHSKSKWQYKTYAASAQGMIKNHINPEIGEKKLQKLTPKDIEVFITNLRFKKVTGSKAYGKNEDEIPCLSSTMVGHIYTLLNTTFDKAVEWKLISENPILCDKPKRSKVETQIWDVEEVRLALSDIKHEQLHLAVHLAFICSLRIGEVLALTWDCIDTANSTVTINKTIQRVSKSSIDQLPKDNLLIVFPSKIEDSKSVLLLQNTKNSIK